MSIPPLDLDDRTFDDLMTQALAHIEHACPEWTDRTPGDPGIVLIETFAFLTETLLYRLNRLPDKVYIELLRLLGVKLGPPAAAVVTLRFSLKAPRTEAVEIPRGTRVSGAPGAPADSAPIFATAHRLRIPPGQTSGEVRAYHCDWADGESPDIVAGRPGRPGLVLRTRRYPIVATGDELDLVVGVETEPASIDDSAPMRRHQGRTYRLWREVESFAHTGPDSFVYTADRAAGLIFFAPALRPEADPSGSGTPTALAAVPPRERDIRIWYRSGGGPSGNVNRGVLTSLKDPIAGVHLDVVNPEPATGGRAGETLDNALLRGPQQIHSLHRVVTARDFEAVALASPGNLNRAHAYTQAEFWTFARPGTVEVVCVPELPSGSRSGQPVTADQIRQHETAEALARVQAELEQRRPLGIGCRVVWAHYKEVKVRTRVTVHRGEDPGAVKARLLERLYATITPFAESADQAGWPFGQPLSTFHVNRMLGSEPGVKDVDPVCLLVTGTPSRNVQTLAIDAFQPATWYAATGSTLYRSLNDGDGWEPIADFPGETIESIKPYPREIAVGPGRPGLLAAVTRVGDQKRSRIHISDDCGEHWSPAHGTQFRIEDVAWLERDGHLRLILATEIGLLDLRLKEGETPTQILVDPADQQLGFYGVAASIDALGQRTSVAVAARGRGGIYLSDEDGLPGTYRFAGLKDEKIRRLLVQHMGPRRYLWACHTAVGDDPGEGCSRLDLSGAAGGPGDWLRLRDGWVAGGCEDLAFVDTRVLAASTRRGVLAIDPEAAQPRWREPTLGCGLPLRANGPHMERLEAVAVERAKPDTRSLTLMAAGPRGVYRSRLGPGDAELSFEPSSRDRYLDRVKIPMTWLFCSGQHEIDVEHDDEPDRD
ncbi:putative baseplate assembly protein [Thioalkalicoccus limnaeus]|uniref:Baseplate assembly protein n=1 Tax=Thioalkalicoccus limnaeus TaxID=120681 RepID=A0ABV4BKC7_9GAMM